MPLSDPAIKKAKPADKPYKLSDEKGLFLLITPTGGKWWRLKYRFAGKEKLLALGTYPDVNLARARKKRDEARYLLDEGIDPGAAKQEKKRAEKLAHATSFESVAREWHAGKSKKWAKVTADKAMTHLEAYVFPEIGHLPVSQVKASQLLAMLRKVESQGIAYTATRLREMCGQVFRYAVATGRAEDNPAAHLLGAMQKPATTHRPAITDRREFGGFLRDLRAAQGYDLITRHACYFALYTFVRAQSSALRGGKKSTWTRKSGKSQPSA